ncbi:hypothetical protein H5410_019402 [Solanum commersonii]|uniref:Uncharacterized protein n=1 Tax=Solanum commersonii TaxID=4109 RepID=A0A9J5Z5H2_SOLCO|nr:hypothetical protein H5410_019402 [Solanum commersonii]
MKASHINWESGTEGVLEKELSVARYKEAKSFNWVKWETVQQSREQGDIGRLLNDWEAERVVELLERAGNFTGATTDLTPTDGGTMNMGNSQIPAIPQHRRYRQLCPPRLRLMRGNHSVFASAWILTRDLMISPYFIDPWILYQPFTGLYFM